MNIRFLEKLIGNMNKELIKSQEIEKYIKIDYFIKNKVIEVCIYSNIIMKNSLLDSSKDSSIYKKLLSNMNEL